MNYAAAPAAGTVSRSVVAVQVIDDRPFVKQKRKHSSYLGFYVGGTGMNFDVTTDGGEPLATLIQRDVSAELQALGFGIAPGGDVGRTLLVSILDWRYEPRPTFWRSNVRFWYELHVRVMDSDREALVGLTLSHDSLIEGSTWHGSAYTVEREMPRIYEAVIHRLVREAPEVRQALEN
jgi:hypothetical protein